MGSTLRIGIDFDNTIASYDQAFVNLAIKWGLIPVGAATNKNEVRYTLRRQEGGEHEWQRLQGRVYGAEIECANLIVGVGAFLTEARARGDQVFIVSHKTEFGHFDKDRINLREAARKWMENLGFFEADGYALAPEHVFFLPTREEKIAQIAALDLNWFIDDLAEVFLTDGFPESVGKILFTNDSEGLHVKAAGLVKGCWKDIQDELYR